MIADEPDDSVSEPKIQHSSESGGNQRFAISMPVKPVTTTVKMIEPFARRIKSRIRPIKLRTGTGRRLKLNYASSETILLRPVFLAW